MFISFKSKSDAIRQANLDSDFISSLKTKLTMEELENRPLVINANAKCLTDCYRTYLDTLVKQVNAYEWRLLEEENGSTSVVLFWNEPIKKAA